MSLPAFFLIVLLVAAPGPEGQPCPVDFRGVRLADAVARLSGKTGLTYVFDAGITPATLNKEIRLTATHLTGEQAFRWIARLAGLQAVLVEGAFLIAPASDVPAVWRTNWVGQPEALWRTARTRQADIRWQDTPPTRVASDMAAAFGVDVIFDPGLLEDPPLVELQMSGAGLDAVCQALAKQTGAVVEPLDGALYVHPASGQGAATSSAPAAATPAVAISSPGFATVAASGPTDASVSLSRPLQNWSELRSLLTQATGLPVLVRGDAPVPAIEARGPVCDILEAGRLLGYWNWTQQAGGGTGRPGIELRPLPVQTSGGKSR